jgi:hypothetical protein
MPLGEVSEFLGAELVALLYVEAQQQLAQRVSKAGEQCLLLVGTLCPYDACRA